MISTMPTLLVPFYLITVISSVNSVMTTPGIVFKTRLGRIRGTVEAADDLTGLLPTGSRTFYAFRGIPYAKPPVGHLRWQEPIAYGLWGSDLDASTFGSPCPQYERSSGNVVGSEDCLFLNVYTPHVTPIKDPAADVPVPRQSDNTVNPSSTVHLPVMVWFHGGGYTRGGSHQFGPQFLMREDVLLVTINYRLGPLGFLSTGDHNLPGNYGLLDAIEALKWVRDNIDHFGGDAGRVTIFGESAGGSITHLLSLSPLANGLFHAVIFQSASALCDWSVETKPLEFAQMMANQLQCPLQPAAMVTCMRGKDSSQLVRAQIALQRYSLLPVRGGPVLDAGLRDKPFLPDMPRNIILNGNYKSIPIISGLTVNEGLLFYLWIYTENAAKMSNPAFLENELVPGVISSVMNNQTHSEDVVKLIKQQYLGSVDYADTQSLLPRISQMLDDSMFTSCVYEAQILHAKTSSAPQFAYLFTYKGQETPSYASPFTNMVKQTGFHHPLIDTGVTHGDELLYLFRMAGFSASYSPSDARMSQMITQLWANFARTGNPVHGTVKPSRTPFWPQVPARGVGVPYLKLDVDRNDNIGADFRKSIWWSHLATYQRRIFNGFQPGGQNE